VDQHEKIRIATYYEERLNKDKSEYIIEQLVAKYKKSDRQIWRYIKEGKELKSQKEKKGIEDLIEKTLRSEKKPIPLSNRNELIRAINQVKESAITYIWDKERQNQISSGYIISHITEGEVDKAYEVYLGADKRLEEESIVAGTSYKTCISSFQNLVKLHVMIRYNDYEGKPDISMVREELINTMTECIQTIDKISQL
jgi:hypothetical protein